MSFLQEFKQFAVRGNAVDLAVAVVIGAAFGKIITSLVDGVIMPLIGLLLGGVNIADKSVGIGNAVVKWGTFLQNIIDFTIISLAIFAFVKVINLLKRHENEEAKPLSREELILLEIRDLMKGQASSSKKG